MKSFLKGKRIYLRGLLPKEIQEDAPYFSWLNDLSLDLYTYRSLFPNNMERMNRYYERACQNDSLVLLGIFDTETHTHIGNITFQEIDYVNRRAFIGYLIGDKRFAGKGIATEAVLMMMYYGFNKLNYERIHTTVPEDNIASIKVGSKAGLVEEGRLRSHLYRNGKAFDLVVVGALRKEWMESFGEQSKLLFEELPV